MTFRFKKADLGKFSGMANEPLKNFQKGCRIMGFTRGDFSLIDLIHATLQKTGPAHVVCVTWSAGIKDANNVKWLMDSNLIRSFNIITDHSYSTRQKKYALSLVDLFGTENITTSEIHAKFTLIHNEDYNVCIRHSMNLNANRTCESFEIDEDKEVFDFYMDFVESNFKNMPKGFTEASWKVNKALDLYFGTENKIKHWSEC